MATTSVTRRQSAAGIVVTAPKSRGEIPSAITASAARMNAIPKGTGSTARAPQWQLDSYAYYDQIGAVRYAAQFTARALPKIRWFAAFRDESGEIKESEDPQLNALWERVQDPNGGRVNLFSTFGQLDFLVGESMLLWSQETDEDEEKWEIVSTLELRKQGKKAGKDIYQRISAPGLTPQELAEADDDDFDPLGDNVRVWRLWRRHPAYSMMADSPMRSVLADCAEIVRASDSINARLISRLAGPGILAIPQSWAMKALPAAVGEENPQEDPFQIALTTAMITAIGKPGSAESVAPIVVRVPDGTTGEAHLYKIWEPNEVIREVELREKALHRFAVGVDMPPSKVEGIEGTSHWNAWMVDEDAWAHIDPTAQSAADNFASAYLRPAARAEGVERWRDVVIGYDPAEILTNPDSFKDALEMHKNRIVGRAYVLEAAGAQDTDAPEDDELAEMLFAQTHIQVEVEGGKLVREEPKPVPPALMPGAPVRDGSPDNGGPPSGEDTPRSEPPQPSMSASAAETVYKILGAAEGSMEEIRGRVGSRLRNHLAQRCAECAETVKGVPSTMVAAVLGPEVVTEHGPDDLVSLAIGGGGHFSTVARRAGISQAQAAALSEVLELHVVHGIYEDSPALPPGFIARVRALVLEEAAA